MNLRSYCCVFFLLTLVLHSAFTANKPCIPRQFDQDSIVCVCNATYCDTIEDVGSEKRPTNPISYWSSYVTTKAGLRLSYKFGGFSPSPSSQVLFTVRNITNNTIMGFGGAFTDAATMTMKSLSDNARTNLINSYFSPKGIEYNFGRIPMASCDFSNRIYSYDDNDGDMKLEKFSLAEEDVLYKIPAIKDAMKVSRRGISLFGSPWSSPYWMKTNNNMTGKGTLKGEVGGDYYKTWANYFVKFLQAYKDHGLDIWGLTAQNEPTDGGFTDFSFQCLGWTPQTQAHFIANNLGPALAAAGFGDTKLMILDDNRALLQYWSDAVLNNPEAAKYVSGIAVHWYLDLIIPPSIIDMTYKQFGEDYFLLNTEACEQDLINLTRSVKLGSWYNGEHYFTDIMQDLKHGISGWIDWNLALNMKGGPNWANNFADSPIIVNADSDEFYKQPMFYAMAHYSKFVQPGSKVVSYDSNVSETSGVDAIFFIRDNGLITANFVNINDSPLDISVQDPTVYGYLNFEIPARSFVTFTWWSSLEFE